MHVIEFTLSICQRYIVLCEYYIHYDWQGMKEVTQLFRVLFLLVQTPHLIIPAYPHIFSRYRRCCCFRMPSNSRRKKKKKMTRQKWREDHDPDNDTVPLKLRFGSRQTLPSCSKGSSSWPHTSVSWVWNSVHSFKMSLHRNYKKFYLSSFVNTE
jgi:hypothetical protein